MKYVEQSHRYYFFHIAIESHGPLRIKATSFLPDLGRRYNIYVKRHAEKQVPFQKITVKIQTFNAVCVSVTFRDLLLSANG